MVTRPIAIDLFAGCGGMSLGLEAAGFDIALSIEFDAVHSVVHHFNFPYGRTICKDIRKVSHVEILEGLGCNGFTSDVDLIAGGPPCQGFSQIGKRQLDDPRNELIFEFLRIVKEIKPKYFLFENVPGIANGEHRQLLLELLEAFTSLGYHVEQPIRILDGLEFGAPQRRKRLILIGSRADQKVARYPMPDHFTPVSAQMELMALKGRVATTVSDVLADLAELECYTGEDAGIDPTRLCYTGFRENFAMHPSGIFSRCHKRTVDFMVSGHLGSVHTKDSIERFRTSPGGTEEPISRFFKLAADGHSNTLRAGTNSDKGAFTAPRPIHYAVPRCISIREAARLHTYPDWFQFHRTIWHGFREIGNSVLPILSYKLGLEIVTKLRSVGEVFPTRTLDRVDTAILQYNIGQASEFWGIQDNVIAKRRKLHGQVRPDNRSCVP